MLNISHSLLCAMLYISAIYLSFVKGLEVNNLCDKSKTLHYLDDICLCLVKCIHYKSWAYMSEDIVCHSCLSYIILVNTFTCTCVAVRNIHHYIHCHNLHVTTSSKPHHSLNMCVVFSFFLSFTSCMLTLLIGKSQAVRLISVPRGPIHTADLKTFTTS